MLSEGLLNKNEIDKLTKKRDNYDQDWRNEHGQPDFEFLKSLATEGSQRSLEKLRAIAGDLNVNYSSNSSNTELIDKILSSVRSDPTIMS